MTTKKRSADVHKNGDSRVSVDREEYAALTALMDKHDAVVVDRARVAEQNRVLVTTCDAQARRLAEVDLLTQNYERVNGLQRVFIDMLRAEHPQVCSLDHLSEFWRRWSVSVENPAKSAPQRAEVMKFEPDLFRMWRIWIRDADVGKGSQALVLAGTRAEVEAQQPSSQAQLQESVVERVREQNTMLAERVRELEAQIDVWRKTHAPQSK